MTQTLINIITERDGISQDDAQDLINETREAILNDGMDPGDALQDYLGLEPDYFFDLID